MAADPIVYCLEQLTDYAQFERLCHELMISEGYPTIEPLGGCHDKGRDALHVNRADNIVTVFCYSVRDDWLRKLKDDAKSIQQNAHTCDRLAYLSTYNFTPVERDNAVKFIKDTYGWDLEPFGLERLRLLLSTKHSSLIANHPQIFNPRFFESHEASEIDRIRSLMDRLAVANENYMRCHLRLVAWPYADESANAMSGKRRRITVAIPKSDAVDGTPSGPDVVLSKEVMRDCSDCDLWGGAGIRDERGSGEQRYCLLFVVRGGLQADAAADQWSGLAAESGRLYQTLPPALAPIHGTTSPRNLWATVLYGRLRGTEWVSKGDGFEYITLPFAASVELWRRLLHGTNTDGRVESSF